MAENVTVSDTSGIRSPLEKTIAIFGFLQLVAVSPDNVGKLTLGLIVIAEYAVYVLAYIRGENAVHAVVQNDVVLMVGDRLAVWLYPGGDYMDVVVPRVMKVVLPFGFTNRVISVEVTMSSGFK